MSDKIKDLLKALEVCEERLDDYRNLLRLSLGILKSKHVIVLKKDDEFNETIEKYVEKLIELGIELDS